MKDILLIINQKPAFRQLKILYNPNSALKDKMYSATAYFEYLRLILPSEIDRLKRLLTSTGPENYDQIKEEFIKTLVNLDNKLISFLGINSINETPHDLKFPSQKIISLAINK